MAVVVGDRQPATSNSNRTSCCHRWCVVVGPPTLVPSWLASSIPRLWSLWLVAALGCSSRVNNSVVNRVDNRLGGIWIYFGVGSHPALLEPVAQSYRAQGGREGPFYSLLAFPIVRTERERPISIQSKLTWRYELPRACFPASREKGRERTHRTNPEFRSVP